MENLDDLTENMSNFYNEVQFPNYDDFDDYASLYDKGTKNISQKDLMKNWDTVQEFLS